MFGRGNPKSQDEAWHKKLRVKDNQEKITGTSQCCQCWNIKKIIIFSKCCTELLSSEPGSQNNHLSVGKINYQSLSDPNVMLGQINPLLYCYSALIIFLYIPGAGTKKHFAVSANTIIRIVLTKWRALSWLSEIHFSWNYSCLFFYFSLSLRSK